MKLRPPVSLPDRSSAAQWHWPRRVKYPIWNPRTVLLLAVVVVGLTAALVFGIGRKAVFVEAELTAGIVAASVFLFLTIGLYHGVRVRKEEKPSFQFRPIGDMNASGLDGLDLPDLNGFDCPTDGGDEGCASAILTLILSIIVLVALLGLLWILINVVWVVVPVIATAIYWVFYSALRIVFAKSKICRGKWGKSLAYASGFTFLYTGWLFSLLVLASALIH